MKLSAPERVMLLGILPREESFVTLRLMRGLTEKLSFTEDELKKWEIKQDGERIQWNEKAITDQSDFKIGERLWSTIETILKKLDEDKKLTLQHVSLYEKFVDGTDNKPNDTEDNKEKQEDK